MGYLLLAVALGGAFGSCLRFLVSYAFVAWLPNQVYVGTLLVNLCGCFAIGFLSVWLLHQAELPHALRTGITVGVLGGLTTFSSFSLEVLKLLETGQWLSAVLYLLASVVGGLLAAWLGLCMARA